MDANRQTHKITFDGKSIPVYRPTGGQSMVAMVATSGGRANSADLKRLFSVMSALCVDPAHWDDIEDGLIEGRLDVPDITRFARQIFDHEWPEPPKAAKKAARGRPRTVRADDDE